MGAYEYLALDKAGKESKGLIEGDTAKLSAPVAGNGGQALNYEWIQTAGPQVTLTDANPDSPSFETAGLEIGTELHFRAIVSDGENFAGEALYEMRDGQDPLDAGWAFNGKWKKGHVAEHIDDDGRDAWKIDTHSKKTRGDLFYTGKLSARKVSELFDAMGRVQSRAGEITLPLLLMHGSADSLASPEGSRFLHEHCGSADKTLKIYPGLFHEIFNEPERGQVFADLEDWLGGFYCQEIQAMPCAVSMWLEII